MQTRGTFPELNAGRKSPRRNGKFSGPDKGVAGFKIGGRVGIVAKNPATMAGRRSASHSRYGKP